MKNLVLTFLLGSALSAFGCNHSSDFDDAVDAIARYKDFRTPAAQLEARKAFDVAKRSVDGERWKMLSRYYYAVDAASTIGDRRSVERANVCEAEIRNDTTALQVGNWKAGDCERLTDEWEKSLTQPLEPVK